MNEILRVAGLKRSFTQGGVTIEVLRGVNLSVGQGEIVALLGPSGSGKSTLLQAVGLLEGGFDGSIRIAGEEAAKLDNDGRTRLRRDALGFVYQFHHLLPDFNAVENVILPQVIRDAEMAVARTRAESLLGSLGLGHRLEHRPSQLSGGEQQRVAVARALANRHWSWRMSPPATWTSGPPMSCLPNSCGWCARKAPQRWWRRIMNDWRRKWTGSCAFTKGSWRKAQA